ncbi:Hypothetical_protein [Hexamita inflata]|uniref:Hypothetical_protein n=1 Tax=Hexamita inflata TaxID=28002 RepID=A0AA86U7R3_9EUKA|nr:Hypothetical protein HINF_LOCUS28547 [Hexamita inflata]
MEADSRFEGVCCKSWQRNETLSSRKSLFKNNSQKARKSWISAGIDSDKQLKAREFCCLELLEALAALTLPTDFSLVRLRRSLSSALPRFLSLVFSLSHFLYQNSKLTFVSRVSSVNPGREMRV